MDNHFKIINGIDARRELNELGYDLPGTTEISSGYMSLMLSMARQIKDLQDKIDQRKN